MRRDVGGGDRGKTQSRTCRNARHRAWQWLLVGLVASCVALGESRQPNVLATDSGWRVVLTDVASNTHFDDFELNAAALGLPGTWRIRKDTLRGGRQEGVDRIIVDTGQLQIVILPTRGMNVYEVRCGDMRLGWQSPSAEIVHPRHVDLAHRGGLGWLLGFNECMVRCGLEFAGHPGTDVIVDNVGNESTMELTLHGRIAHIPASRVEILIDRAPPHRLHVLGVVHESHFYGPRLRLNTDLSVVPGEQRWRIRDTITNVGASEQEFELIYHTNCGAPLLEEGAQVVVPTRRVMPMNDNAARAMAERARYRGPTLGFVEEVFLIEPYADDQGRTSVLLHDRAAEHGTTLSWNVAELPFFTLWKNTAAARDGYVTGLEPGTSYPFNRRIERAAGRVPTLMPEASRSFTVDFGFVQGAEAVANEVARITGIAGDRPTEVVAEPPESR